MNEEFIKGLLQLSQKANGYNIAAYFRGGFSVNIEGVFDRLRESKGFLTNIGDTYASGHLCKKNTRMPLV